ncbi:tektin-3-like [Diaphorina citri]|uniref:Tektin n=1 Tax=Diaphorina citri TaxID=121845 RepID=A0A3Q0IZA7_DIACI|nr:tektin-3-like [Diaphorina citri]
MPQTIMHSNLLPWSSALVDPSMSHACYPPRPMLPAAPDNSSHIHAPDLAIQGVQGFETTSIMPLTTRQMAAHIIDPCYQASTDVSRAFDPVKLPSIAASFERNPSHAARAAMYTRFTPYEWTQSNINYYNEADANRNLSEKIRSEAIRVMRETEERTAIGQRDSGRRLGERLTDITFWRNELSTELEKMLAEIALLQDTRRALEKAIRDCEPPLSVAQECLYHREARQGIDLVHDQAEQALLKEIETLRHCKEQLNAFYNRVVEQLRCCRSSQHEVEMDIKSKHSASQVDSLCYQMNNYSRGINYFAGIESVDPTLTIPESWADHSNRIIQRSSTERSKSSQLRSDSDNCINDCANRIWNAWNYSNSALARRTNEILEAKNKLQMHLHKVSIMKLFSS